MLILGPLFTKSLVGVGVDVVVHVVSYDVDIVVASWPGALMSRDIVAFCCP